MSNEQSAYEIEGLWDDRWFGHEEQEKVAALARAIPHDVRSLLDVGCGNGLFLRTAVTSRDWERICGIDRSAAALRHVTTEKYSGSADALPFADKEFDAVTSFDVIEHLPLQVFDSARRELARVAAKYIVIAVPLEEDIRSSLLECPSCMCQFNVNYHMRSFDEPRLRNLFDGSDFECAKTLRLGAQKVYPPAISRALFQARRALGVVNKDLPDYAICPVCGYRGSAPVVGADARAPKANPVKEALKKLVPKRNTHRGTVPLTAET